MTELSEADQLHYVALGDSLAYGTGANNLGYPHYLHQLLEPKRPAKLILFAIRGQTSRQLLQHWPLYAPAVSQANLITWNIGGNDLRYTWRWYGHSLVPDKLTRRQMNIALTKLAHHWNQLAIKLRQTAPEHAKIFAINLFNPYQHKYPQTSQFVKKANQTLAIICQNHGIKLIDAYSLIHHAKRQPGNTFLASDQLHLNAQGYQRVGETIFAALYPQPLWKRLAYKLNPFRK